MSSNHTCQNLVHTLTSHFMLNQFSGRLILRQFAFPSHPVQEKGAVRTAPISPGKQ